MPLTIPTGTSPGYILPSVGTSPPLHNGLDLLSVPFKQWAQSQHGVNYGWHSPVHNPRLTIWQRLKAPSSLIGNHPPTPDWPVFRGPPTIWQRLLESKDPV